MADKIVIVMPTRDGTAHLGAAYAMHFASKNYPTFPVDAAGCDISTNRNALLCRALTKRDEEGFTRLAMIDSDIVPDKQPLRLDALMAEMIAVEADMIAVACPLRMDGPRKHSNISRDTPNGIVRFSMKEIFALPATFTDPGILCGAGLILFRIDKPWAEQLHFDQVGKIGKNALGQWGIQSAGEDFAFTRLVRSLGGKVFVTRKIGLYHGFPENHNRPF